MPSDYANIRINNIVAKSELVPPFSLSSFSAGSPPPTQHILSNFFVPFDYISLSVFHTGSVISRSSRSVSDVKASFRWLRSVLAPFNLELSSHYDILNIAASVNLLLPLNLSALALYLPNCSYDPSPLLSDDGHEHLVNCITFSFQEARPHYTALIFPSGKVTFAGFKSIAELELHAFKISSLISEISLDHPGVFSTDE